MKDRLEEEYKKEKDIDKKIKELEFIIKSDVTQNEKMDSIRAIIGELKDELLSAHYNSMTDDLTGFVNKKTLIELFNKKIGENIYENFCFSLIIIDVDKLKIVNDRHGHLIGTKVLLCISEAIEKSIRKSDIASRYGGDEFVVLTISNNELGVKKIIDRIRYNIEKIEVQGVNTSASIGYATYKNKEDNFKNMFLIADKMLYEEKKTKTIT